MQIFAKRDLKILKCIVLSILYSVYFFVAKIKSLPILMINITFGDVKWYELLYKIF